MSLTLRGPSLATVGYATTKRVTAPIFGPETTQTAAAFDRGYRTVVKLPVTTTRWRLRFANRNVLAGTSLTTPLTSSGLYIGNPAYATDGHFNANFTTAPTLAVGAFAVPTDGTDYVSPWVTDPAQQFTRHADRMLSWNIVATATGTGIATSFARQNFYQSSNGATLADDQNASGGFFTASLPGDMRVEYEFAGAEPVGVVVADSIGHGRGDGDVTNTYGHSLMAETWPGMAGELAGIAIVNLAVSSATTQVFTSASASVYTRADLAATVPDFAVYALGANDLTTSLATVKTNTLSGIANLRSFGIPKVYLATIIPQSSIAAQAGTLQAGVAAGVTSLSSSINPGTVAITVGIGRNQETVTVSAVTGTGPYTLTVGATTKAHAAGEQIIYSSESNRQALNDWIRQIPASVAGVIDFDSVMAQAPGSSMPDMRLMSVDGLHPLRAGYQRMAQLAAAVLGR